MSSASAIYQSFGGLMESMQTPPRPVLASKRAAPSSPILESIVSTRETLQTPLNFASPDKYGASGMRGSHSPYKGASMHGWVDENHIDGAPCQQCSRLQEQLENLIQQRNELKHQLVDYIESRELRLKIQELEGTLEAKQMEEQVQKIGKNLQDRDEKIEDMTVQVRSLQASQQLPQSPLKITEGWDDVDLPINPGFSSASHDAKIQELEKQIQEYEEELTRTQTELNDVRQSAARERAATKKEIEELRKQRPPTAAAPPSVSAAAAEAASENARLLSEIDTLRESKEVEVARLQKLLVEMQAKESRIPDLERELVSVRAQLLAKEREILQQEHSSDTANVLQGLVRQAQQEKDEQVGALNERVAELENELTLMREQMDGSNTNGEAVAALEEQIDRLTEQVNALTEERDQLQASVADLQAELESKESSNTADINALQARHQAELTAMESKFAERLAEASKKKRATGPESSSLKEHLDQARSTIDELEQKLAELQSNRSAVPARQGPKRRGCCSRLFSFAFYTLLLYVIVVVGYSWYLFYEDTIKELFTVHVYG